MAKKTAKQSAFEKAAQEQGKIRMAKGYKKVVLIETFRNEKYVLQLDREYEKALAKLLRNLFKGAALGSIAHISLRNIKEEVYDSIQASTAFMEQKGNKNGKTN